MNTKYYFVAMVLVLMFIGGGYWVLDQNRDTDDRVYCPPESRLATTCLERSTTVCGWFDPAKVKCIAFPCAQDYGNECEACKVKSVLYYTPGGCPEPG